ncbi:hypothetical protein AOLI_G00182820 [Acnodon oligacanthus]
MTASRHELLLRRAPVSHKKKKKQQQQQQNGCLARAEQPSLAALSSSARETKEVWQCYSDVWRLHDQREPLTKMGSEVWYE